MNFKHLLCGCAAVAIGSFGAFSSGNAATQTSSMGVTATVQATCTVSATAINLGNITAASLPVTGTSTVTVNCTNQAPYDIGLSPTSGSADGTGLLTNTIDGSTIAYGLFQNAGYTVTFGNLIGTATVHATGSGVAQTVTCYIKSAATGTNAHLAAGSYADTVTVTVTF